MIAGMRLSENQWSFLESLIPRPKVREDARGRPWRENREVLEGILWVLKTGARWKDMPKDYPPYQTCHRRFQSWVEKGILVNVIEGLISFLREKGEIDLTETYIDATFIKAKKKVIKSVTPKWGKGPNSWQSQTQALFLSDYPLRVLHHMRQRLLRARFGDVILQTYLSELWVTKLTIQIPWMIDLQEDLESNLLLPISQIGSVKELKMADLCGVLNEDGEWSGFLLG